MARYTLGAIYYKKGDYEAMFSLAQETLQFAPEDTKTRVMLSEALAFSGKLIEAELELQKALEFLYQREYVEPEELSMVRQQLGIIYAMRGHREKALKAFQEAIDAQPIDEWAQELLESYKILDIIGIAMKGTPIDRRNRLLSLTEKRAEARRGKGLSQGELAIADLFEGESPMHFMRQWTEGSWLDSSVQGVMLKLWPSRYLGEAIEIVSSKGIFEAFQKGLEEKIQR